MAKKTDEVIRRDREVFLTTTRQSYPFVAERGEGDFAYDIEGREFIDFTSFISVYNMGVNSSREVREAIKGQVDKLMHAAFTDYYSELPVEFGEMLIRMFPKGFGKIFLSNSGTEANEAAIKFSKLFTKRHYTIAFYNSFHGRTNGSLGMTASKAIQRENFGPFTGVVHVPFAYCYRCPFNSEYPGCGLSCVDYIRKYPLSKEVSPKEVAAIFTEPIQGEGGYIVPPKGYFKEIKRITEEHGMLLISDEVQAGYMRTGKFLAMDNFGVEADIYTMAKSIGAGLPMGATVARRSLGDIPAGSHSNTFGGNLAAVAGAKASLGHLMKNRKGIEAMVMLKGAKMKKALERMAERHGLIGDVRGIGMMLAIELVKDRRSKEPAVKEREEVIKNAYRKGLLLLPAGESSIRIIPPLTISEGSMVKGLEILEESIKMASKRK
ncbi:MAG: aminotransferase class III-fold pyridoxal phosphate-dependent enzyme [Candidatus Marsarchaeota archaeon]|nr:aminotransferase class III-fold pyridoxal phosphate-dependent enzyme [Candidatus Marsarchaeota archaeon]